MLSKEFFTAKPLPESSSGSYNVLTTSTGKNQATLSLTGLRDEDDFAPGPKVLAVLGTVTVNEGGDCLKDDSKHSGFLVEAVDSDPGQGPGKFPHTLFCMASVCVENLHCLKNCPLALALDPSLRLMPPN